jgi:hypothetical protein
MLNNLSEEPTSGTSRRCTASGKLTLKLIQR